MTFSVGPLILPWTGIDGFLPWGIGIVCIVLSILPLTFVKVAEDAFHQKEGGGFFGFVRRAPLLLFAVGAATLFDNVLISFFTIFGIAPWRRTRCRPAASSASASSATCC